MRTVFVDTWGWINLFNRRERHHQSVSSLYQTIRKTRGHIITTDFVLDEVYTLLYKRVPGEIAQHASHNLSNAIADGYVDLEWITPKRFENTQKLRMRLQDKPDISFTDLTSMIVMQENDILEIITGDSHFLMWEWGSFYCHNQFLLCLPIKREINN